MLRRSTGQQVGDPTYPPLNALKRVAEEVWIVDGPVIRFGTPWPEMPLPTRMTSIRRAGDKLFIHSPTPLACGLKREIEGIGAPRWIVGLNRIPYWWIPEWHAAFPDAEVSDAARSAVDLQKAQARTEVGREDDDRLEPRACHLRAWTLVPRERQWGIAARLALVAQWMRCHGQAISQGGCKVSSASTDCRNLCVPAGRDARLLAREVVHGGVCRLLAGHHSILGHRGSKAPREPYACGTRRREGALAEDHRHVRSDLLCGTAGDLGAGSPLRLVACAAICRHFGQCSRCA